MKSKSVYFYLGLIIILFQSCTKKSASDFNSDFLLYSGYISTFTSGIVPAGSDIRVVLAFDKKEWRAKQILDRDLFTISPDVDGKVVALSPNTLAFVPDSPLPQDTEFRITLQLSKLIKTTEALSKFNFSIHSIKQDIVIETADLQSYDRNNQYLNAVLKSADVLTIEQVAKILSAEQSGKALPVKLPNDVKSGTEFRFYVDSIKRYAKDSQIGIAFDGGKIGIKRKGVVSFPIIGRDNFAVVNIDVPEDDNQTLLINFSDALLAGQDFNGLIAIEGSPAMTFSTEGNVLKVYFTEPLKGSLLLEVFSGIESSEGFKLKESYSSKVSFDGLKPNVRFVKSGTIMPSSNNLRLNFEAVNLSAVDIKVYKIYKDNILQFLQYNELNGGRDLRRVGQPVAKAKIDLTGNKLLNPEKWNTYALNLEKVITPEPGAIYRVEFSFKQPYSLYECTGAAVGNQDVREEQREDEEPEDDVNYSDLDYDEYYYEDDYEWRDEQDPCSRSYFYNRRIATNIIASDLGVIAKRGSGKTYFVAVNNIVTTKPVSGASVVLYSYQQQKLATANTGDDGTVQFSVDKFAYFAVVSKDGQSTYIKLDDGNSLSLSNFDVSGAGLQKGLKGYIYGERGVWRPGDNVYLSFILDESGNRLPAAHPVKFRLSDPKGKIVFETVQRANSYNHYAVTIPTSSDAPTGNWEAMVTVGGARFYKSIKIETIKPNRLKIRNTFSPSFLSAAVPAVSNLEVTWLHGAIARNNKVLMQAKFTSQPTVFKSFAKYRFDDIVRKFASEEVTVFSGKTDEFGKARVSIEPRLSGLAPGMLKMTLITKVYEEGGDISTDVTSADYSPYPTYVGIKTPEPGKYGMLETRKDNRFEIATVDEAGRPRAVSGLQVQLYKTKWRWWWDSGDDNVAGFESGHATIPYKNWVVSTNASGMASITLNIPDEDWGRYIVRVTDPAGKHATAADVLVDWPSWSGKTRATDADSANMLVFTTDKKEYQVGEKAMVSFPSSEGARALISIENGSKILRTMWAETRKGETTVAIPVTEGMAPNVYFNITQLQPHASTKNDSPIRMYGVLPVNVIDKSTILQPVITMPDVLKPEQSFELGISEKSGKEMTYTVAVVDEGLLDLTRFKTPNAWNDFYAREALGVRTWDIYDDVIGAYGGKVSQIFSIGGDQDLGGGQAKKANRFKPAVVYLGPYVLAAGQTKTHKIKMPKYIGSVRTMVVAADTKTEAYGQAEKTTAVRSPLMLLASVPRKISPSERIAIPVTVFAMEPHVKQVTVQMKTSAGFTVKDGNTQSLTFPGPDEKMAYFNVDVGNTLGIGTLRFIATSGRERSVYEVEIDITNPNPVTYNYTDVILAPGSSKAISWTTFGIAGSNKAQLEVSSSPAIDLNRRLKYLIEYPHGCLEQTTSVAFPQLYLNDIADIDEGKKKSIQRNVTSAIKRLGGFQLANGGFMYWPGNRQADDWGTSYAGHFMIEAEKKGYILPISFRKSWIAFQQKEAKSWRTETQFGSDIAQAYRLYTLALAGAPDLASMNRLRETSAVSNEARLRLAAAYVLAGQKAAGTALLAGASLDGENPSGYYYYGSPERNRAMALETLILTADSRRAFEVAARLAREMSSGEWMSTQTTAYCLYAMAKFAASNGGKGITAQYNDSGKALDLNTAKSFVSRDLTIKTGRNAVTLVNKGKGNLFVRVLNSGILPVGNEQAIQNNVSASIVYKDRKGNILDISKVKQGTEFIGEVTVTNRKNESVGNIALTQILPSGFEIVNTRFTDYGDATSNTADYIDIRDDRANFYFGMSSNQTRTFRLLLNASYTGVYYLPGLQCEAMYDHSFLSRSKGRWIEVIR